MPMIYCVEDDGGITELISCALKAGGYEVRAFSKAKELYLNLHIIPDMILLDLMLPDEDGFTILEKLKQTVDWAEIPVIILTAKTSEIDKVTGLEAGADDYITKPFGVMELLSRIKAVLRRVQKSPAVNTVSYDDLTVDLPKRRVLYKGQDVPLTYKEFEVLTFLLQNQTIAVTRERIMERVWGYDYEGETRTLDMHIKTLRQKLEQAGCIDLIKTVRGVGYKI